MNLFKKVTLQVKIGNTKCKIESRLVNINVSLLLKIARNIWDLKHDKGVMLGELVELHFTSSDHCCINVIDNSELDVLVVNNKVNEK